MKDRSIGKEGREGQGDLSICLRLLREARPYHLGLCLLVVVSMLAAPATLLAPYPLKLAIDSGLGDTPVPQVLRSLLPAAWIDSRLEILGLAALLVVLVTLLTQAQSVAATLLRTILSERMVLDFRAKLFEHVQRLSFAFHDRRGSSDSTYRILWDAAKIQSVTTDGLIPLFSSTVTLAAMLYVTMALNWQLGLVALAIAPLLVGVALYFRPKIRRGARQLKRLESAAFSVVPETLGALRVVKAFCQEDRQQGRFVGKMRDSLKARIRYLVTESGMAILVGLTTAAGTAAVLYVGAMQVLAGRLTLGELILILSYIGQLYGPLKAISGKAATMQSHLASAERALALLDEPFDVPEKPGALPIDRAKGRVTLDHVTFRYADGPEVLSDVSLDVMPGTRVGIAGRTGAGKTTLISLLMRFFDTSDGAIYLDGVDLRDYRIADLRRQFAIVLQDPILFSTSIRENIAYGRPDASDEQISAAATAANIHDFITGLPDGYQTQVGERGMRLSGGERQRISLARAFLTDAPLLILDEPTSSVDVKTEAQIMEAIKRLMRGRTTFMIAHRLSTLAACDLQVTLEGGALALAGDVSEPAMPV